MEGRVGEIGQAVRGGTGASAQWRTDFLGGRDGDDRPFPGQQRGQEGGLRWGAESAGHCRRGGWG